ncbi:DNA repair protein rad2, partial [Entophlyctis sp. JEL0112]
MDADSSLEKAAEKLLQQQLRLRAVTDASNNSRNTKNPELQDAVYMEFDDAFPNYRKRSDARSASQPTASQVQPNKKTNPSDDAYLLPPQSVPLKTSSDTDQRLLDPADLAHFISQHLPSLEKATKDFDKSATLASLSLDVQYQIILSLKTQSREASASRVAELLKAQQKEGPQAFSQMQIEGKEYILIKDEARGAGFTMKSLGASGESNIKVLRKEESEYLEGTPAIREGRDNVISTSVPSPVSSDEEDIEFVEVPIKDFERSDGDAQPADNELLFSDDELEPPRTVEKRSYKPETEDNGFSDGGMALLQKATSVAEESKKVGIFEKVAPIIEQNSLDHDSLDMLASVTAGGVPDDMPVQDIMNLFERNDLMQYSVNAVNGNAVSDDLTPEQVMQLFSCQDNRNEANTQPIYTEAPSNSFPDNVSDDVIMDAFKQKEVVKSSEISDNLAEPLQSVVAPDSVNIANIFDSQSGLLLQNFSDFVPEFVKRSNPDVSDILRKAETMWTIDSIESFCETLERRKMKLPDSFEGNEKAMAINFILAGLHQLRLTKDLNLINHDRSNAPSTNSEPAIPDGREEVVSRSVSPAISDHSLHSLLGRINDDAASVTDHDSNLDNDYRELDQDEVMVTQERDELLDFIAHARDVNSENLQGEIRSNIDKLIAETRRGKRESATISSDMIRECQELLKLFGIPYLTAPMEAESQCAFLSSKNLVDGIITDDSDVFLFGGSYVYKNFFNQKKFVECYKAQKIEDVLGLRREHLIALAYLLGSDYTEGIDGIGHVTGMEILIDFCGATDNFDSSHYLKGLGDFKDWVISVQRGFDASSQSKIRSQFKTKARNLDIPAGFPDQQVFNAYIKPEVNESLAPFVWGSIDIE